MMFLLRAGMSVAWIAVLFAALVLGVGIRGWKRLHPGAGPGAPPPAATVSASLLARGEHVAAVACASCHGATGVTALSGGEANALEPVYGVVFAPNLTPGGVLGRYDDAQLARAVRDGIARDGRRLLGMPATGRAGWTDEDLAALAAWLRAQPPVSREVPPRRIALRTYLLAGVGLLSLPGPPADTLAVREGGRSGMTVEHGRALSFALACRACHGPRLFGARRSPLVPRPGGDLVEFARRQSLQAFDDAMRRGVGPDGTVRDRGDMPYAAYRRLTDTEIGALYTYLQARSTDR